MRQKLITVGSSQILLQQLPGDAEEIILDPVKGKYKATLEYRCKDTRHMDFMPPGNWQLLFTFSLDSMPTEEQAAKLFPSPEPKISFEVFCDVLKRNEVLLENPYGEEPDRHEEFDPNFSHEFNCADFDEKLRLWQSAEEKVCRGKIAVLRLNK